MEEVKEVQSALLERIMDAKRKAEVNIENALNLRRDTTCHIELWHDSVLDQAPVGIRVAELTFRTVNSNGIIGYASFMGGDAIYTAETAKVILNLERYLIELVSPCGAPEDVDYIFEELIKDLKGEEEE